MSITLYKLHRLRSCIIDHLSFILLFNRIIIMQVKFTIDYDLIELVDAIGLDYTEKQDQIEIVVDNIEELIDDVDDYNRFNDEELCEYLLNPTLCEGLIYTQRIYD